MVTKEKIQKKIEEHGEKLKQINEQARSLQARGARIQQSLIQASDEAKIIQGALRELQDLLRELNEDKTGSENETDSPPEDETASPPVDDPESGDNAQS